MHNTTHPSTLELFDFLLLFCPLQQSYFCFLLLVVVVEIRRGFVAAETKAELEFLVQPLGGQWPRRPPPSRETIETAAINLLFRRQRKPVLESALCNSLQHPDAIVLI
jgi:hypothetical protein